MNAANTVSLLIQGQECLSGRTTKQPLLRVFPKQNTNKQINTCKKKWKRADQTADVQTAMKVPLNC